jgi:hypothetical protein
MNREGITEKPVLADTVNVKLRKSIDDLEVTKLIVTRDGHVPDEQHIKGLKEFARRTIKRFSHTKEKEKLMQYVENHFVIGETFGLRMPKSILALISREIQEISNKRQ